MDYRCEITKDSIGLVREWIASRGGVAVWKSSDLGDPTKQLLTPAQDAEGKPYGKPRWWCEQTPDIVTSPAEIGVYEEVLFETVKVALRIGASGLKIKITDFSQRRVDRVMAACREKHGSAYCRTGGLDRPEVHVCYVSGLAPLGT